jgi:hypothetical protein
MSESVMDKTTALPGTVGKETKSVNGDSGEMVEKVDNPANEGREMDRRRGAIN